MAVVYGVGIKIIHDLLPLLAIKKNIPFMN